MTSVENMDFFKQFVGHGNGNKNLEGGLQVLKNYWASYHSGRTEDNQELKGLELWNGALNSILHPERVLPGSGSKRCAVGAHWGLF